MVRLKRARITILFIFGALFFLLSLVRHGPSQDGPYQVERAKVQRAPTQEYSTKAFVKDASLRVVKGDVIATKENFLKKEVCNENANHIQSLYEKYTYHCSGIMENDGYAYSQAKLLMTYHPEYAISTDAKLTAKVSNCSKFLQDNEYPSTESVRQEDKEFPIAYSIVFHKDVGQLERLLRNIYQPQNVYCLHVDKKASDKVHKATQALVKCFPNVFISSQLEYVIYASFSRLQADINCMKDLVSNYQTWKYVINLTGQVFPLKTNSEIVKILKIYNGANDIEGSNGGVMAGFSTRYKKKWGFEGKKNSTILRKNEKELKDPPPHNITLVKGSAFGVFSRAFVEWAITNKKSLDLLDWSRDTFSPDEIYWSTLNHVWVNPMLAAPGGYGKGVPDRKPWLAMYASWKVNLPPGPCAGRYVHNICIFTLRDLPNLISRKELFANKFYRDTEPLTIDCLEKWLKQKSESSLPFDGQYYRELPFVSP